jgi:hypothetical protein
VGPRTSLEVVVKRKNPWPCQESNTSHPAHSLVTILMELLGPNIYISTLHNHSSIIHKSVQIKVLKMVRIRVKGWVV